MLKEADLSRTRIATSNLGRPLFVYFGWSFTASTKYLTAFSPQRPSSRHFFPSAPSPPQSLSMMQSNSVVTSNSPRSTAVGGPARPCDDKLFHKNEECQHFKGMVHSKHEKASYKQVVILFLVVPKLRILTSTQCPAVSTCLEDRRDPPQKVVDGSCSFLKDKKNDPIQIWKGVIPVEDQTRHPWPHPRESHFLAAGNVLRTLHLKVALKRR